MSDGIDWNDPEVRRRFFAGLRTHLEDADAVTRDLLRRKRKRQLGHREHARLYRDAWKGVLAALAVATPEQGDSPSR
jgi:hypothetical protein